MLRGFLCVFFGKCLNMVLYVEYLIFFKLLFVSGELIILEVEIIVLYFGYVYFIGSV